jgi:hypothetical protein
MTEIAAYVKYGRRPAGVLALVLVAGLLSPGWMMPAGAAEDLDAGSQSYSIAGPAADPLDTDCFQFGGQSQAYSGADRLRGNTYTVDADQLLIEFKAYLDLTEPTTLFWYVLESPDHYGTYTVISETITVEPPAGPDLYSSGHVSVPLRAGRYYGIGVAWGPETVGYVRDAAAMPRNWALGTVEDAMQHTGSPPYTSLDYNHFAGAEYRMALCFDSGPYGHLLYDVDFGTPPHTIGDPPVLGTGPAVRETPTAINFGDPMVVDSWGMLQDQPCLFGVGTTGYDQLEFGVAESASGFPEEYDVYHAEMVVMIEILSGSSSDVFKVFLDAPAVNYVEFAPGGIIRVFPGGGSIGHYNYGIPLFLEMSLDLGADQWRVYINGSHAHTGPANADYLRTVRLHLQGEHVNDIACERHRGS